MAAPNFVSLASPMALRCELETSPRVETVESFVMTRAAARSWQIVNRHLAASRGKVFWITGPAGSGKTHLLNYIVALAERAGAMSTLGGRHLVCGFELAGRMRGADIGVSATRVLAEALSGREDPVLSWRERSLDDALGIALADAARTGIRAITMAIDLSIAETEDDAGFFATLADAARASARVRLTCVVASRNAPAKGAVELRVAPANPAETARVAISRARTIDEEAEAIIADLYCGVESGELAPEAIFPFHPSAVRILGALADPTGTIPAIARCVRDALASAEDEGLLSGARLLYPADLMNCDAISRRVDTLLDGDGARLLGIAQDAALRFSGAERRLAREMVATLAIVRAAGDENAMTPGALEACVPIIATADDSATWTRHAVEAILRGLSNRSGGVIALDGTGAARFDLSSPGSLDVAAFNAALPVIQRFDPAFAPVRDPDSLEAATCALRGAMADAVEAAERIAGILDSATAVTNASDAPAGYRRELADFIAIAGQGPEALIERVTESSGRERVLGIISRYEWLAIAAEVAPRLKAMREYAIATGLRAPSLAQREQNPRIVALANEAQILIAELGPRAMAAAPRDLYALEARFQKFKWSYVEEYLAAHGAWRIEMDQAAAIADDVRRHADALGALNVIAALGAPAEEALVGQIDTLAGRLSRCDFDGALRVDLAPRCSRCGYRLGEDSPRADLEHAMGRLRHALRNKLAIISQSAIARIIREHDRAHRLLGLFKIMQMLETDAFVRVLDDRLARYLARLLDENLAAGGRRRRRPPTSISRIA